VLVEKELWRTQERSGSLYLSMVERDRKAWGGGQPPIRREGTHSPDL